jgi:hypothetical protein
VLGFRVILDGFEGLGVKTVDELRVVRGLKGLGFRV